MMPTAAVITANGTAQAAALFDSSERSEEGFFAELCPRDDARSSSPSVGCTGVGVAVVVAVSVAVTVVVAVAVVTSALPAGSCGASGPFPGTETVEVTWAVALFGSLVAVFFVCPGAHARPSTRR